MLRETFAPIDKFDEMNKFLGSHKLPKLIQMIKKEIWTVALKPSKKKKISIRKLQAHKASVMNATKYSEKK